MNKICSLSQEKSQNAENAPVKNVTMQQIAAICNVSKVTVGRAFLHPDRVHPVTRKKILKTADELGYTYNALAASLGQSRKPFVGLITSSGNDSQLTSIIRASQKMLREENLDLLLGNTELNAQLEELIINRYIQYQALGIVMYGITQQNVANEKLLLNPACPVLLIGDVPVNPRLNYVGVDIYKASYNITEYLIRFGHTRIGLLCGPYDITNRAERRFTGYKDALEQYGIKFNHKHIVTISSRFDGRDNDHISVGYHAMKMLLETSPAPTAVIFPSDIFALGGVLYAQEHGFNIPKQVSVVSMYEYPLSSWVKPSITTMRINEKEIAGATIEFFRKILDGTPPLGWNRTINSELIIRESCSVPE